jgi:hypothetical protein
MVSHDRGCLTLSWRVVVRAEYDALLNYGVAEIRSRACDRRVLSYKNWGEAYWRREDLSGGRL